MPESHSLRCWHACVSSLGFIYNQHACGIELAVLDVLWVTFLFFLE